MMQRNGGLMKFRGIYRTEPIVRWINITASITLDLSRSHLPLPYRLSLVGVAFSVVQRALACLFQAIDVPQQPSRVNCGRSREFLKDMDVSQQFRQGKYSPSARNAAQP
jgi:hypothetical protein